jgi:hypothetical protein
MHIEFQNAYAHGSVRVIHKGKLLAKFKRTTDARKFMKDFKAAQRGGDFK